MAELRRLRDDPAGFDPTYWRRGAELGWTSLLVSEERRGRHDQRGRPGRPHPDRPRVRRPRRPRAVWSDQRRGRRAQRTDASPASRDVLGRPAGRRRRWPPGALAEPRPHDRARRAGHADHHRSTAPRWWSTASSGRSNRPGSAAHLLVTGRTGDDGARPRCSSRRAARRARSSPCRPSTSPAGSPRSPSTTCASRLEALVGAVGQAADQVAAPAPAGHRHGRRRVGRGDAGRLRHDRRVGLRPLLVRPAAGLLPGDQAPLRRHADVAGGQPRHQRRRGRAPWRAARPEAAELVSAAKAFIGQYGAELLQDCVQMHGGIGVTFEHDLHLYLRRVTVNRALLRHPRRAPPADRRPGRRAAAWSDGGMSDLPTSRVRSRPSERGPGPGSGPTSSRSAPDPSPRDRSATTGSDEEELAEVARDREIQRMLFDAGLAGICFPTRVRRPGPDPGPPDGRSTRSWPATSIPARLPGADLLALRRRAARLRHRGAEAAPHPRHPEGRGDLDAVPLRAQRRLGRGRRPDHRGARRRRVGAQRLEGLDHRRLVVGLGPVPGPHQLGRAQAPRA